MKNTKNITALLLFLFIFLSWTSAASAASAANPDTSSTTGYITTNECMLAGEKWIKANYPEGTKVSSIIPIKDLDDRLNGYCINFSNNEEPAGYLVLNAAKYCNSYIREFSLDGVGIYEQLISEIPTRANIEKSIYSTDPFEYAVKYAYGNEELYYNSDASVMTTKEEEAFYGNTSLIYDNTVSKESVVSDDMEQYYSAFFYGVELTNYTSSNVKNINGTASFTPYTMSELRTGTNTGNCSPTAITNICAFYQNLGNTKILENNNIYDTYSELVNAIGFDVNGDYEGVSYQTARRGLTSYVQGRSCKITTNRYSYDWWTDFKRDFDKDKINFICIVGKTYDDDNNLTRTSHQLVGVGYRILNDGTRYIRVYDGWNPSNSRFLIFKSDTDLLYEFMGTSVVIS